MQVLQFIKPYRFSEDKLININITGKPIEEIVKLLILRDLINLNWEVKIGKKKIEVYPTKIYDKDLIRKSMSFKRDEIISKNKKWIDEHIELVEANLINGNNALKSEIIPKIVQCKTDDDFNLFRLLRYYWSSPYSEYVGRRIKLIIRDYGIKEKPVIGIAALGSPIIHVPERDTYIGWNKEIRTKNLIYTLDAYVIGALPPYNYLLGGKLISYILASNEVRKIYNEKYRGKKTLINGIVSNKLVGMFTTSLFGRSSQYNKIKYNESTLYNYIGETKGFGSLHLSEETFGYMRELIDKNGIQIGHKFGDGPSWRIRVIRTAAELLEFDPDLLLRHSFKRKIYYVPLAENSLRILRGEEKRPKYFDRPATNLVDYWKIRWLKNRKKNLNIINEVMKFKPEEFKIYS